MRDNLIAFVRKFVDFSDEDIDIAQPYFTDIILKKGEHWIKEGEYNADVAFINKGMVRSYFIKEKVDITFDLTIENQIFSNTTSYSLGLPSSEYIQAIEDCDLCVITKVNLHLLYAQSPKWERLGRIIYENYTVLQEMRVRSFISETAKERYEILSKTKPELIRRTPQIYLANYLGITPQSLSRLRREITR